jgi:LmbE family N-acetylglucosaminyl deacetylase
MMLPARMAPRWLPLTVLSVLVLRSFCAFAQSPAQIQSDHLLKADLLFVGAHPDDESGVAAAFAREVLDHGARAALVLVTRGEGGGNAIGKELGPSLGLLREAELRRSAAAYGVDLVYFLDKTDFFYTLSSRAAFDVWGHDDTLERLVRLVRLLRPDVIVTMWPGPGTHGMHQAAARLATEAFTAAADSTRFPAQLAEEFLRPWQPLKLYYNTDQPGALAIPSTDISPSRFMSYAEIKTLALRTYRSQGFDRFASLPPRRAAAESFLLVRSLVPPTAHPACLTDGVDQPVDRSIRLGPPPSSAPASVAIVPREDVAEFRRWAEAHDVAWAAGLLPASRSIGIGQSDTLMVEVRNPQNRAVDGQVTLTLPPAWNAAPMSKRYAAPARGSALVAYTVAVPASAGPGSYPVQVRATAGSAVAADSGRIDVLPVMRLARTASPPRIDGRLDDWPDPRGQAIPATAIWSGELPGGDADCSGVVRAVYDPDYLYVAVDVRDDAVVCNIPPDDIKGHWRSDAVEICLDPSGRSENTLTVFKTGIFPGTTAGRQARAARDADARQGVIEKTAPGMRVASAFTSDGYSIEAAIAWQDVPGGKPPAPGQTIGFNVILYDGDDAQAGPGANIGKARLAWSFWPSAQALPYYYGRAVVE